MVLQEQVANFMEYSDANGVPQFLQYQPMIALIIEDTARCSVSECELTRLKYKKLHTSRVREFQSENRSCHFGA